MVGKDSALISRLDNDPMRPLREGAYFTAVATYILGLCAGAVAFVATHTLWVLAAVAVLWIVPWIGLAFYWNMNR